jgi:hypothetical protein
MAPSGPIRRQPEWAIVILVLYCTYCDFIVVRYATGRPSVLRMASTILYSPVREKVEPGVIV